MHEMALCESILQIIEGEAHKQDFSKVRVVRLEIGALSHIAPEAMLFCFDAVTRGTLADGAKLEIEQPPGEAWCMDCEKRVEGGHIHAHTHDHHHDHASTQTHDHHHYGEGPAGAHAPGLSQSRMVEIEQNILSKNDAYAANNRQRFEDQTILALNLVSSPGSGKTTLLVETIKRLVESTPVAVIEGDQETSNDAERIRATGVKAVQVNTGKGCHLDAHMVGHAADHLSLDKGGVLFIENVGNLVCPAGFDLGETARIVLLSVTEGDDKPLKYPDIFANSDLLIITKSDLAPYVDFDVETCISNTRKLNPDIEVLLLSSKSGEQMDAWIDWITAARRKTQQSRIERLETELARARAEMTG